MKVGDRVIGIGAHDGRSIDGKEGMIKEIDANDAMVHFEKPIGGCGSIRLNIPRGHGWWVPLKQLRLATTFQAGDMVEVVDSGGCFLAYKDFFAENGLEKYMPMYRMHDSINSGIYKVVAIGEHRNNKRYSPVYVLKSGDQVWLMYEKSIFSSTAFLVKASQNTQKNTVETLKVIRNGKATIVILTDGSKGVAKCHPDDEYKTEYGLMLAYQRAIEGRKANGK